MYSSSTSASPVPSRVSTALTDVRTCVEGVSVEARVNLSSATVSSCSTRRSASSSSTRRVCSAVSRSSTKSASSSHASAGVTRCGSSRLRAGGTGCRAVTSLIRLSCRSRRPFAFAHSSRSRSASRRNSSAVLVSSGSASISTRTSVLRTPEAPMTRARTEPGSIERGSPVTSTRPLGGTVPRATRLQSAPCAYTTTASRVDAQRGVVSAFM